MAGKMSLSGETAIEYARRFPDAPTQSVARAMHKENPALYPNLQSARMAIARVRGKAGNESRAVNERMGRSGDFQALAEPGYNVWGDIPDPIGDFDSTVSVPVEQHRILILSDVHFPFHAKAELIAALEYGLDRDADAIILNGDILDCYALSRYEKDPRLRDFGKELDFTRAFLRLLRDRFPKARIYYKWGNHEERFEAYMRLRAPEILGLSEVFELQNILGLKDLGITHHTRRERLSIGRLDVIHGHEYGKGGGVTPARWLMNTARATSIMGHLHRTSQHSEPDITGKVTSTWTTGCLCGLSPEYARYNKWTHGFAYVESDGKDFSVNNLKFIDGRIY